ncbi:hypothetical protein DICVIV_10348 [Dictyocaulus viviparus]|uniref:Uncharacterized protein n=1 Tax=Dictyocaulus viviparus TaxID=29172 RepID=A0A0D8XG21_DICVI|nr:hypothetical protein DICVIV_10348 [Dictyocaulus viviparus]
MEMYTTWRQMIRHWPKTTLCIVSNEFCERFSYYGMRTVLILYLLNVLKFTGNQSTIFFNSFTVLCYFTPLIGSIIADGYIGKFCYNFVMLYYADFYRYFVFYCFIVLLSNYNDIFEAAIIYTA